MELKFRSGGELFLYKIDRSNRKLTIASSKTNYIEVDRPWTDLFDKGKEELQDKATTPLSDFLFKHILIHHMKNLGYKLIGE